MERVLNAVSNLHIAAIQLHRAVLSHKMLMHCVYLRVSRHFSDTFYETLFYHIYSLLSDIM